MDPVLHDYLMLIGILVILLLSIMHFFTIRQIDLLRKKTDHERELAHEHFSKAFEANPAGLAVTEFMSGKILDANESYFKLIGYTREEALGKSTLDLMVIDEESRTEVLNEIKKQGKLFNFEILLVTKSGQRVCVLCSTQQIQVNGTTCLLTTLIDITPQKKLQTDLLHAYQSTLEGWSKALELRDIETQGHSSRVTALAVRLAQKMLLKNGAVEDIRRGALLHDIGKIGIPDRVLLKPDKLTDDEWVVMKQHPAMAYGMLKPIRFLSASLSIPYCHHEKWDGTGYPRQLKGEQIPLAARIFAVVDVFDALTSERPYRAAWPAKEALEFIQGQSGTHFDPAVVVAFSAMVEGEFE